jgi:hypothetical protein
MIQIPLLCEMLKVVILKCTSQVGVDTEQMHHFYLLRALIIPESLAKMVVME